MDERSEQVAVVNWARREGLFIYAVPNGGRRNAKEAMGLKREGVLAGIPDLQVVLPDGRVLWVEMKKRKGGTVSKVQKDIHTKLEELGHSVCVAKGAKEAVEYIKRFI